MTLRKQALDVMADAWARYEEGGDYEMSGNAFANLRVVAGVQLDALLAFLLFTEERRGMFDGDDYVEEWRWVSQWQPLGEKQ